MKRIAVVAFSLLAVILVLNNSCEKEKKKMQTQKNERFAVIETNKGTIKFKLFENDAPITAKNFIDLANKGFYNNLKFHRVEPGFVIQGGDPKGDGSGGSEKTIPLEVTPELKHDSAGVVAMARTPDPNSASSQFYITLNAAPFLDMQYAVFGKVVEGLDVVKNIRVGDVMKKVIIADK
ncbi:MAG: peptidylprolyl isomerase [Nitrospirae bacterium]|nr:peptidylprolyl isomerase [Nitrospirota bacterium]